MGEQHDGDATEMLRLQFDKSWELMTAFFDWRHRVMVRFAVAVAALLAGYIAVQDNSWWMQPAVLGIGAIIAAVAALLDRVNQGLVRLAYEHGVAVEAAYADLGYAVPHLADGTGIFSCLQRRSDKARPMTYNSILGAVYSGCAVLFASGAVLELLRG